MGPIKLKDTETYEHSIRVAYIGGLVGKFMHLDYKALIYAGLLHDTGKALVPLSTLQKTSGWTPKDAEIIRDHVMRSYELARDKFNFSAEVLLWHHMFQPNSYPNAFPEPLSNYSQGTRVMIPFFGRALALCDSYDAAHRANDKHEGEVTGHMIKERMFDHNPDQKVLLEELYKAQIFTTQIFTEEPVTV
jgi:putative nucleotidyltransferase with HDIG domain